jgi:methylthioribose-1-phosphate isomerase
MIIRTIEYRRGAVEIIDQALLPGEERIVRIDRVDELAAAISSLRVRGAPAIGIAAAYGMLLALENHMRDNVRPRPEYLFDRGEGVRAFDPGNLDVAELKRTLEGARETLVATRPTAANLLWALERISIAAAASSDPARLGALVAREAFAIHAEELEIEYAIGRNGERYIRDGMNVLTHCNAGGLATAGYGTALGVLYTAWERGRRFHVYVDETRPLLQGARLTAWELGKRGIPYTILCEGAAPSLFAAGKVDAVVVGADRIAANGDTANKVGTLGLAVLCRRYGRPFYVAAPVSTFDPAARSGKEIPIEQRSEDEVLGFRGARTAPEGARAYNPAFDVTPAELITAIICDRGIVERPGPENISSAVGGQGGAARQSGP